MVSLIPETFVSLQFLQISGTAGARCTKVNVLIVGETDS